MDRSEPRIDVAALTPVVALDDALDEVHDSIRRYCVLPSDEAAIAITLWVAATHAIEALDIAPRLVIRSAEKRSGKTRLLEVLELLASSPVRFADVTVPYLFRRIEKSGNTPPTLLLDEADAIFGQGRPSDRSEALRGILNSGFQRGSIYGRVERPGNELRDYRVFAMAAIAAIGRLPATIEDRSIVITMRRRRASEPVEAFRYRDAVEHLGRVRTELRAAVLANIEDIASARPEMPVVDRAADLWEPLVATAGVASDDWLNRAWSAALSLVEAAELDDQTSSEGLELLVALRAVFRERANPEALSTAELLPLIEQELGRVLGTGADARGVQLARALRPYAIAPRNIRFGASVRKGYLHRDLVDVWERYLPIDPRPLQPLQSYIPVADRNAR